MAVCGHLSSCSHGRANFDAKTLFNPDYGATAFPCWQVCDISRVLGLNLGLTTDCQPSTGLNQLPTLVAMLRKESRSNEAGCLFKSCSIITGSKNAETL